MPNARTATAADFDKAAQRHANAFWGWLIVTGLVWWFASAVWTIIPAALTALAAASSIASTRNAARLRAGTFPIPNTNNGAPDGDAANLS